MSSGLRVAVLIVMTVVVAAMWGLAFVSKRFERVASGVAALEPREFDGLSVLVAGSGGTFENPWRRGPVVAVGAGSDLVLVDAGRGAAGALRAAEIPVQQPLGVFLTSLAAENTLGLADVWLSGWLGLRDAPLRVYGPPGTRALVEGLARSHAAAREALGADWELPAEGGILQATELGEGDAVTLGALEVRAFEARGTGIPTLVYRVATAGRAVVVAGVTGNGDRIVEIAAGADVLVVGAIFGASLDAAEEAGVDRVDVLKREATAHLRLEDVGRIAARAGVGTLVLTRLRPPPVFDFQYERAVGASFPGRVVVAADGTLVVTP